MKNLKSVRIWIHGLASAAIGGAASSITAGVVAPESFNFQGGLGKLATLAGASALVAAALYLKQSPLPPASEE